MHEYSIVQALVDQVAEQARGAGATSVTRLRVRIGDLSGVERALLATAYATFRERTICANAELDIVAVEAVWACKECGRVLQNGAWLRCPRCKAPARLVQGDEIVLERIEMEVPLV